jgi:hypothetical protein
LLACIYTNGTKLPLALIYKGVSKPPNVRSACVEIKASLARTPATAESWLKAYDRAPLGQVQSFHASGSAKDLGSEYSRWHHCPSFVKAGVGTC